METQTDNRTEAYCGRCGTKYGLSTNKEVVSQRYVRETVKGIIKLLALIGVSYWVYSGCSSRIQLDCRARYLLDKHPNETLRLDEGENILINSVKGITPNGTAFRKLEVIVDDRVSLQSQSDGLPFQNNLYTLDHLGIKERGDFVWFGTDEIENYFSWDNKFKRILQEAYDKLHARDLEVEKKRVEQERKRREQEELDRKNAKCTMIKMAP